MISLRAVRVLAVACALALGVGPLVTRAQGEEGGGPSWHLEQPLPPELPNGQKASTPIGLGKIGDIEFSAPNRGLLITAGNPPTIPSGLWAYNGVSWHELSTVCGASDGRIAWEGSDKFWTISDGRPGQASSEPGKEPPLADNTLCHFSGGQVVGSYASLAFRPDSYQAMHGAACFGAEDCWFAGDPLPEGQIGAFHLHWDGHSLTAEPNPQGHAAEDLRLFNGGLYEGVRISLTDMTTPPESPVEPSILHLIAPKGVQPTFLPLRPGVPVYAEGEFPAALDFLHLSADEEALWGAADPASPLEGSTPGEVTIVRDSGGLWSQVLGPSTDPPGGNPFTKFTTKEREKENEVVASIAAYPRSESAWLALDTKADSRSPSPTAPAVVARISADGTISEEQTLPSAGEAQEGVGPKGAADKLACPAVNDCWMVTTQGWLFHLSDAGNRSLPEDTDPAFSNLITYRPPDQGLPQVAPDAPPVDDSGLIEAPPSYGTSLTESSSAATESRVAVPLLSHLHSRLVHGTTLELRFHLAVKARIRLIAKRRRRVVASTAMRTLAAGNRKLLLRLDPRNWPTKLDLQTHPLAPLPTASSHGVGSNTVGTGLLVLPHTPSLTGSGPLP
jgi:hypothetical protein